MPPTSRLRACAFALFGLLALPASASAVATSATTGGASPEAADPHVDRARCITGANWRCASGQRLRIRGAGLADVTSVAFIGGPGGADDVFARPRRTTTRVVSLDVPAGARTGRLRVRTTDGVTRTRRSVRIRGERGQAVAVDAPAAAPLTGRAREMVFPIDGDHDMGQSESNHFGGGRGHQGHDLFAACGTPLVALTDAEVQHAAYHSAAGHYVVLRDSRDRSYAYMHLRSAARVDTGDRVRTGQRIGEVGQTGRATGCHLHFEQWTAPGWYSGGRATDPLPLLRRLEAEHEH